MCQQVKVQLQLLHTPTTQDPTQFLQEQQLPGQFGLLQQFLALDRIRFRCSTR